MNLLAWTTFDLIQYQVYEGKPYLFQVHNIFLMTKFYMKHVLYDVYHIQYMNIPIRGTTSEKNDNKWP